MIRRNSFFGLLGFAVPVLVLLISYPVLIRHLGMARLGIYLLATSMSGALAFLDAGFSAATLKFIAEDLAQGRRQSAAEVLAASMWFYGAAGLAGGLVLAAASPWLVGVFKIQPGLRGEALWTFRLASVQFAVFFMLTVFISLFKGMHRFHLSTLSLSLLSVLTYGGAVLAVLFAHAGLMGITAVGVAANAMVLAGSAVVGLRLCGTAGIHPFTARPSWEVYKRMLGFGSAMLINGFASLLQNQIQRYIIGIALGPAAVGIYQTASVAPGKIHAAVNAATEVMFPLSAGASDRRSLRRTYLQMLAATVVCAGLAFPLLILAGPWFLSVWLRENNSPELRPLLMIFAIAYFFLALTPPPYHLLNGMGKPWINTLFFAITASLNVTMIGVSWVFGISLAGIAWAYTIAVLCSVPAYYLTVERSIWAGSPCQRAGENACSVQRQAANKA
jgi:O-antigen/teichoic acid export membrane protein